MVRGEVGFRQGSCKVQSVIDLFEFTPDGLQEVLDTVQNRHKADWIEFDSIFLLDVPQEKLVASAVRESHIWKEQQHNTETDEQYVNGD